MLKQKRAMISRVVTGVSLFLVLIAGPQVASAHPATNQHYHLVQQTLSLKQAAEKVQANYGGQVLKAERTKRQGPVLYRIRLMTQGHVREFLVDASSGKLQQP
ncbi:MAG: PepSY domain-containing protein [Pontibacterium sp.]